MFDEYRKKYNEIEINDIVVVCFLTSNLYSFQTAPKIFPCRLRHEPQNVGDNYKFLYEDNTPFTVNPNCSNFVGIELLKKEEKIIK